jgi:hypothetical protein
MVQLRRRCLLLCFSLLFPYFSLPATAATRGYKNFEVAVYIPEYVVEQMSDAHYLQSTWEIITGQVKVDKVYLETYRSGKLADDQLLEQVKKFFLDQGVAVAGGMGLTVNESNNFQSFDYTDPKDRAYVKTVSEKTARHFDEIILDDFYFNNTKSDADIAAKGNKTWAQYRLGLMDGVSKELIVGPAKAVNPKVKVIIKFPNWYESFQDNGYDLENEPAIFDGIWTGNETRDPSLTPQHLQQYESYEIFRYFENIAPGRNDGGWVDTGAVRYVDRYAEQLWDTMLAKAPAIMLFKWTELLNPAVPGQRESWGAIHTSLDYAQLSNDYQKQHPDLHSTMAGVAGYSLAEIDPIVGALGKPIGIASYKPYNSSGEDFLQDYLGMMGIPMEMYPKFPQEAGVVLLTRQAAFDPQIVAKIKAHLQAGKNVVITSGLVEALQDKGLNDIVDVRYSSRKVTVNQYAGAYGAAYDSGPNSNRDVLLPVIEYVTNDAVPMIRALASGNGFPILLSDHYSKGIIFILTVPDNFSDLYSYPPAVVSGIKNFVLGDFPVRLDGPNEVSLFAYDNHTFVVESYLDHPTAVTVSLSDGVAKIRNLDTGDTVAGQPTPPLRGFGGRLLQTGANQMHFQISLPPHSYAAFTEEK